MTFAWEEGTLEGLTTPHTVIEKLSNLTARIKDKTIITTGVSQLSTTGYGLPAAIGAKIARPDALVIGIDSDISFSVTLTELSTMAQFNVGAKAIILNNVSGFLPDDLFWTIFPQS